MLFELRQYRMRPGQRENWVKFMEDTTIPFQVSKGMVIRGSFAREEDRDLYMWLRRFASEEEWQRLDRDVYEDDYWKNEISPKVPTMFDREPMRVTRLMATPRSVIQ